MTFCVLLSASDSVYRVLYTVVFDFSINVLVLNQFYSCYNARRKMVPQLAAEKGMWCETLSNAKNKSLSHNCTRNCK